MDDGRTYNLHCIAFFWVCFEGKYDLVFYRWGSGIEFLWINEWEGLLGVRYCLKELYLGISFLL